MSYEEALERAAALGAPIADVRARGLPPMLADRGGAPLHGEGWLYELKLDGVRTIAEVREGRASMVSRRQRDVTDIYPEVAEALAATAIPHAVFDGEIVTFDEHGRPSFERLGQRFGIARPRDAKLAMRRVPVTYVVFDLLALGDRDLRPLALARRKELLQAVLSARAPGAVRVLDAIFGDGRALFDLCKREKLEGIVAKRADAPYRAGMRGQEWVKLKCQRDDEFVVVGWAPEPGGGVGSLDLGSYEGERLVYRGRVGSGLNRRLSDTLLARFSAAKAQTATGDYEKDPTRVHVAPEVVVRVRYTAWTEAKRLRHPVLAGVCVDVEPGDCRAAPDAAKPLGDLAPVPENDHLEELLPFVRDRAVVGEGGRRVVVRDLAGLRQAAASAPRPLRVIPSRAAGTCDWLALSAVSIEAARAARAVLDEIGLPSVVLPCGGGALQVTAPLGGAPWDAQRAIAGLVAELVRARAPRVPPGAVDPSPSREGAALVAPWSPLPGGGVAEPVEGDARALLEAEIDLAAVARRIERAAKSGMVRGP